MRAADPRVVRLVEALTAELAASGYTAEQTFGYSLEQLEAAGVHLVGAVVGDEVVGLGGVELDPTEPVAELKRFFVLPAHRGTGAADAVLGALLEHAAAHGVRTVRLETGDKQHAALRFYSRNGFTRVPPFGPYVGSATSVCLQRALP